MKIYKAGKVTGEKTHAVTLKFGTAEFKIKSLGHTPVNPLTVVNDWHCPWDQAMTKCLDALEKCDAVLMLPCYTDSRGAKIELEKARSKGLKIYFNKNEIPNL